MMDIEEDECSIVAEIPSKKKKMKQAQLPFQIQSPVGSPKVGNKKRKLSSPSIDNKSRKPMKILKKNVSKDVNTESDNSNEDKEEGDSIEVLEEIKNSKDSTESTKVETGNVAPKRNSTKHKIDKEQTVKLSPLTKFFQKSDKEEDNLKEQKNSSQESKDKSVGQPENDMGKDMSSLQNDSLIQSDSDISSSDDEDNDDQKTSTASLGKGVIESPQIPVTPKTSKKQGKKLTPKQQEKLLLSAKRKEERQKQKLEKEKRLEEERQNRQRMKEEKMMEKKIKEQKRQMEIEQKKQAKEEERRKREEAKEEEKKKKEEEKLEMERKKQKAASNFTSFFVPKKQDKSDKFEEDNATELRTFMPFEVKADMKLAPVCRRTLNEQEKLLFEEKCKQKNTQTSDLYLSELRDKRIVPRNSAKTWPFETKDDVILLDEENDSSGNIINQNIVVEKQRAKLLQFSENQRPPYWGTWRKRSRYVNPRKPFTKDTEWFNYEVDSDEEWEEEEPGESLRGSDDEKDEENPDENEYDVDNEFMVPHGYLSDEELRADEEDKEDMSPETQKFKLKVLGEQFELERNSKTCKLKPKIIGCIWRGSDNKLPPNLPQRTVDFISAHEAWIHQIPVTLPTVSENDAATTNECVTPTQRTPSNSKQKRAPEVAMPDLIRLVHGNTCGLQSLVKEFLAYWSKQEVANEHGISKNGLRKQIRDIATWCPCPEKGPLYQKKCWYVPEDIRNKYVDEDFSIPNRWSYNSVPIKKSESLETPEKIDKEEKDKEKKVPLITQFTKKISQEEMKMQLSIKPAPSKPPKRASLISVPRGKPIPETIKQVLLKTMNNSEKEKKEENQSDTKTVERNENSEVNDEKESNKENEDRLGIATGKEETQHEEKKMSPKNTEENEDDVTMKSESSLPKLDDLSENNLNNTVDNSIVVDIDG